MPVSEDAGGCGIRSWRLRFVAARLYNFRTTGPSRRVSVVVLVRRAAARREERLNPTLVTEAECAAWAGDSAAAFAACRAKLLACDGDLAERLLVKHVRKTDGAQEKVFLGNPEYIRSAALEDLDCKVSGGRLLVDATGRGRETRRRLDARKFNRAEWQGQEEFHALFRQILRRHSVRELGRDVFRNAAPLDDLEIPCPSPGELIRLKLYLIRQFALLSELLRARKQLTTAELADAIIGCLETIDTGLPATLADPDLLWETVREKLGVEQQLLYKRKELFYQRLIELREDLPEFFVERVQKLQVREAENAVADCERARERIDGEDRETLDAIRDCFRQGAWPPDGTGFAGFCQQRATPVGAVEQLIAALERLEHKPKRLIGTLKSMFPELYPGRR